MLWNVRASEKKGATARVLRSMDAILLIIGIDYGVCRIVIWPGPDVNKHGFRGKHMHFVLLIIPIFLSFSVFNSPLGQYVGYAPGKLG